jgi:hypothetical protein
MFVIFGFLLRRSIKEMRETREFNWTRFLFIAVIASNGIQALFQILIFNNFMSNSIMGTDITIVQILESLTVTFALMFVFYVNKIDLWLLFAPTLIIGNFVIKLTTNVDVLGIYYYAFGFLIGIIQLYYIGIKYKDNNTFGMGIMFTLIYIASNMTNHAEFVPFVLGLNMIGALIGLLIISGVIKIYKNIEDERFEEQEEIING